MKKEIKLNYCVRKLQLKKQFKEARISRAEYRTGLTREKDAYIKEISDYYLKKGKKPPQNPPRRSGLEEIGNSVTHGLGAAFAAASLVLMLIRAEGTYELIGALIYFVGMFLAFLMSSLYHAFPYGSTVKRLFRRFDYSSIYLMIGATYAPILLSYLGGRRAFIFLSVQWAVIITGISLIGVFGPARLRGFNIPMYILLGWSGIVFLSDMIENDFGFFLLIIGGGIIYSLGIIPFAIKARASHFIWHIFVLGGAVIQWIGVYSYIYLK